MPPPSTSSAQKNDEQEPDAAAPDAAGVGNLWCQHPCRSSRHVRRSGGRNQHRRSGRLTGRWRGVGRRTVSVPRGAEHRMREVAYDRRMTYSILARLVALLMLTTAPGIVGQTQKKPAAPVADGKVWLTPTCGCCGKWVDHMHASGFKLTREVTTELDAVPERKRVPEPLRSCHTALIGRYLVEGHVPADLVRQLLKEQPKIAGIATPGMPVGSPGMEGPGARSYSIVAFRADGTTYEFARR